MAEDSKHCKPCGYYFDTYQSLNVHLQYCHHQKENLRSMWMNTHNIKKDDDQELLNSKNLPQNVMSMWMNNEDMKKEDDQELLNSKCLPISNNSEHNSLTTINSNPTLTSCSLSSEMYNKSEIKEEFKTESSYIGPPQMYIKSEIKEEFKTESSFVGPPPISPMEYDHNMSFKTEAPLSSIDFSPKHTSNSYEPSNSNFSQTNYYQDFTKAHNAYPNYSSYSYDDNYYRNSATPRFHPYMGKSPVPTHSPGNSTSEIKDERLTPSATEILDLDSQKVFNNPASVNLGSHTQNVWRPHELFPLTATGVGSGSLCLPSTSPSAAVHLTPNLRPSPNNLPRSPGSIIPISGFSPGNRDLNMHTTLQNNYRSQSTTAMSPLPPNSSNSGFNNSVLPSFYPQTMQQMRIGNSNSMGNPPRYIPNQVLSPRDGPGGTVEYPSNVKRAKSFKCEDCSKWFTSHGHLKRHYNTTLHKNMTKSNAELQHATPISQSQNITSIPVVSPCSTTSIGDSSVTSNNEDDSIFSTASNQLQSSTNLNFIQPISAFQPPHSVSFSVANQTYPSPHPSPVMAPTTVSPPSAPPYRESPYTSEQPLTSTGMYHGNFSSNPTTHYANQPIPNGNGFFIANNYYYPQQGGVHGPGFHSTSEIPGPASVDCFNSFRFESNNNTISNNNNHDNCAYVNGIENFIARVSPATTSTISPEPVTDTASEASMDSSESAVSIVPEYNCKDCKKTFNRMCYLTQHRMTCHDGVKPFKCSVCGKRFMDERIFTEHQGKHGGEKPYKCDMCPKQFNHKTDLRRHMCLHTGEKPFKCENCGKGFIRKDHMLKHLQTHKKKAMAAVTTAHSRHHPSLPATPPVFARRNLPVHHSALSHPVHLPSLPPSAAPPVY